MPTQDHAFVLTGATGATGANGSTRPRTSQPIYGKAPAPTAGVSVPATEIRVSAWPAAPSPRKAEPAAQARPLPPMEPRRGIRGRLDDLADSDWFDGRLLLIVAVVGLAIGLIVAILLVSLE